MAKELQTPRSKSATVNGVQKKKKKKKNKKKPVEQSSDTKVPLEAENFEHTIRRMINERERNRRKNLGLYR